MIYELDKLLLKTLSSFYDYLKLLFVDSFYFKAPYFLSITRFEK